jgi:hypothetical protein
VAKKLRCSTGMAGQWRVRFLQARLEGLYDEPRLGVLPQRISMVDPFRYALPMRFWRRTGCRSFAASARASRESQAVPVAVAQLECQGAQVFIQVIEF